MKGKDLSSNELHTLTGKNADQEYYEEENPDKIAGLGHDKKSHMNSGIYSGVESREIVKNKLEGTNEVIKTNSS